jgi:DNA mismatch repair protein MutL
VTIDGPTTVTLNAVPVILARADLTRLLSELAARLPETTLDASASEAARELQTPLLATFACHAAVRAGEELGDDELKRLLAEARTVDFYHNCPHGRRVFRWFPRDAVAAWFDR